MAITQIFSKPSRGFGTERNSSNDTRIENASDGPSQGFWIELDVTVEETHNVATRVTTNPVQNGAEVANNAINDPIRLSVVGGVTNTPLLTQVGNFGGSVAGITGLFSGSKGRIGTRVQSAYEALLTLQREQILITVDTGLRSYTNMILTNISTTTTNKTQEGAIFNIEFTEIITPPQASADGDMGNQSTVPPSETDLVGIGIALGGVVHGVVRAS